MVKERLQNLVAEVLRELQLDAGVPVLLEAPRDRRHGDYSTNVALVLARQAGRAPRDLAREIAARLEARADLGAAVSLAGPGFINFTLHEGGAVEALRSLLARGAALEESDAGRGEPMQIEFVSANPTGPLNVVSARAAAYGSTLARMLTAAGHAVATEFYVNDAGRQVELLGWFGAGALRGARGGERSVSRRRLPGRVRAGLGALVPAAAGRAWLGLERAASLACLRGIRGGPRAGRGSRRPWRSSAVRFDRWFRESELHLSDRVQSHLAAAAGCAGTSTSRMVPRLFATTTCGDDKDRVVVRSDGAPTYFLADVAYHRDKHERGYRRVIDVWGPDHHGHIPRMQAVARGTGIPGRSGSKS